MRSIELSNEDWDLIIRALNNYSDKWEQLSQEIPGYIGITLRKRAKNLQFKILKELEGNAITARDMLYRNPIGYRPGAHFERPDRDNRCEVEGCPRKPREGKPFCSEHIGELNYIQQLQAKLAAKELEELRAKEGRLVEHLTEDTHSIILDDILIHLRNAGPRTTARLSRELGVPEDSIKQYVQYLKERGDVTLRRGTRRSTIVELNE